MTEKTLGADAAAVETTEPVASDAASHDERSIYQRACDVAANGETVIDVVCDAVTETLKAVSEYCEKRGSELWALNDRDCKQYAASYYTLQDWCADQIETAPHPHNSTATSNAACEALRIAKVNIEQLAHNCVNQHRGAYSDVLFVLDALILEIETGNHSLSEASGSVPSAAPTP